MTNTSKISGIEEILSREPKLYVIGRQFLDLGEIDRFLDAENTTWARTTGATPSEEMIEFAGRICYMSFGHEQSPKSNREYIHHLVEQKHESVLEHASWTFLLTGVSRAFTHQFVRHRVGFSFSQLSQQYHDEKTTKFVVPDEVAENPDAMKFWLKMVRSSRDAYASLSQSLEADKRDMTRREARRSTRSAARSILPNAAETKIVFSANGRSLRHFLSLRGGIIGDLEMRKVSALLFEALRIEAPALLSGFCIRRYSDGHPLIEEITSAKPHESSPSQ